MYILIKISTGGIEENVLVSETKTAIVKYLAKRGYKLNRVYGCNYYTHQNCTDVDYYIEKIDLLKTPSKNKIIDKYWDNIAKYNSPKLVEGLNKALNEQLNNLNK